MQQPALEDSEDTELMSSSCLSESLISSQDISHMSAFDRVTMKALDKIVKHQNLSRSTKIRIMEAMLVPEVVFSRF